jgi:ABC-type dipeptide/oligopeptide/nickel transport system ATPase component
MKEIINWALQQPFFDNPLSEKSRNDLNIKSPLHVSFQEKDSKLYIITGENATGKSYFIKTITAMSKQNDIKPYRIGMISRSSGLYGEGGEHFWSIVPEEVASTGENSALLLLNGLEGIFKHNTKSAILLDEPTFGFSIGYQKVIADYIANFSTNMPAHLQGLFVCAHDYILLSKLSEIPHNHLRFGDDRTLKEVLNEPYDYTIRNLKSLPDKAEKTRHQIKVVEDKIKAYNHKE